jgi:mRNA interferase RelE/StbE
MKRLPHKLHVPPRVADLIRHLHPQLKHKLRAALEQILTDPHSGKALKDDLAGLWSFRLGRFRVVYRIGGNRRVDLIAFGPRERIYEETYRLIARPTEPGSVEEPRGRYRNKGLLKSLAAEKKRGK